MGNQTIQTRFTLWAGICLLTTIGIVVAYSAYKLRLTATKTAEQQIQGVAQEQGFRVKREIDQTFSLVRGLGQTLSSVKDEAVALDIDRESVNGVLKIIVKQNPEVVGLFTCWEPNAFDDLDAAYEGVDAHDETGRFIPYVYRDELGEFVTRPLEGYADETIGKFGERIGEFYLKAKEEEKELVLNPICVKKDNQSILVARIVVPIVVANQFHGIVGADVRLANLQTAVEGKEIYEGASRTQVITNWGVIVADSRQPELRGTMANYQEILDRVDSGHRFSGYASTEMEAIQPVNLGLSDAQWMVVVDVPKNVILRSVNALMYWQIIIGGCSAMIAVVVLWLLAGRVTSPIRQAVDLLRDIAQGDGDLTKTLEVNCQDELGELASYFNEFCAKVRSIVTKIAENAATLAESSNSLRHTATELASGAAGSTKLSEAVAAASEQMSLNITRMAGQTEEMTQRIRKVANAAAIISQSNSEVANNANEAAAVARNATQVAEEGNQRISHLDTLAESIGKVTFTIQEIAEQTNLLALNATIEAARAGEAGKGFGVVANEVKDLARQTADATEDIRARIEEIQGSTAHAVKAIRNMADTIEDINQFSQGIAASMEAQSATIAEVATNVNQSATAAEAVSTGLSETATASSEIAQNIVLVDQQSKQTAGSADQTTAAGRDLSGLATTLYDLVNQFKY
ncbi:HAMP domain-containing protein [bacterium]|nr:HAMP domain-containing protein [bacterium]